VWLVVLVGWLGFWVWLVCWFVLVCGCCSGLVVWGSDCTRFLRTQQCALKVNANFVLSRAAGFVAGGLGFFELVV
ncbi:hypothetical protein, partial [Propionibacterium cyclohexanicum]|uniref:hypothetical protein n=1 Tax=Propionibacterium cyclohexanicum TaxID=64702 RepID=UPI001C42EFD4